MASASKSPSIPSGYQRLAGSERHPSASAKLLAPADPGETFSVTIVVRRRTDGPPLPDLASSPPPTGGQMSPEEFAAKYGASPADLQKVVEFVESKGLKVVETHAARRTVVASGTVAQMNHAFGVTLGRYQHEVPGRRGQNPQTETYRGREGFIHVPSDLAKVIVGVFGLDNRRVIKRNSADPPNTKPLSVQTLRQLYNFPTNSAAGQTIAILSEDGYQASDINLTFGGNPPKITDVAVDASNSGNADGETTQDICIAAMAAPGAAIAVYFTTYGQKGWVDLINRVIHPNPGDPHCSVLSSSFYLSDGDDQATLTNEGLTTGLLTAVNAAFQDAALLGLTVCIASGDTGTNSKVGDQRAHVQYPASDPFVLSVGGTTVGNVAGSTFTEYVWNDPAPADPSQWGTTGGGVSDFFALPRWQADAGVPKSVNDNTHVGRGVPDVAGNASYNSGYSGIYVNGGDQWLGNGTSASSPLWAGLIAVINAAIGKPVGFVNPAFYALGSAYFRSVVPGAGPADNGNSGVKGYPAGPGWDACTGWGSPDGVALLNGLKQLVAPGTISGKVTDLNSGLPIQGATVTLGSASAYTDAAGNYSLSNIPYGYDGISASAVNYDSGMDYVAALGGQIATVNFQLEATEPPPPVCHGALAKKCPGGEPVICPNPRFPQ